jgi:hypothetical protein
MKGNNRNATPRLLSLLAVILFPTAHSASAQILSRECPEPASLPLTVETTAGYSEQYSSTSGYRYEANLNRCIRFAARPREGVFVNDCNMAITARYWLRIATDDASIWTATEIDVPANGSAGLAAPYDNRVEYPPRFSACPKGDLVVDATNIQTWSQPTTEFRCLLPSRG